MTFKQAEKLLPTFKALEGVFSKKYKAIVNKVFVSQYDSVFPALQYKAQFIDKHHLPKISTDSFTVVAKLSDDRYVPVKSIILLDDIENLKEAAHKLPD